MCLEKQFSALVRQYQGLFLEDMLSQPEIRDYSWRELVLSLRRTFQELRRVTSHTRDHISQTSFLVQLITWKH